MIFNNLLSLQKRKIFAVLTFFLLSYFLISTGLQVNSSFHRLGNKVSLVLFASIYLLVYQKIKYNRIFNYYLAFIGWSIIGAFLVAVDSSIALDQIERLISIYLMSIVVYSAFYEFENFKILAWVLVIGGLLSAYGYLLGMGNSEIIYANSGRFQGLTNNPNSLATNLFYVIIGVFYLFAKKDNKFLKSLLLVAFFISIYTLFFTGSRKFALYIIIVSGVIIILKYNKPKHLIFIALLGGTFIFLGYEQLMNLFKQTELYLRFTNETSLEQAGNTRLMAQVEAFKVFFNHPFFGVGLENLKVVSIGTAHGYIAEVVASGGIIAFTLLFAMYYKYGKKTIEFYKNHPNNIEALFVLICLLAFFLTSFGFHYYNSITHWFIFAATYAYLKKQERNEVEHNSM